MRTRKLGHTNIDVSVICLGTMTWGNQNTEADAHEQMDYALDQGVNFFDTAELYAVPPTEDTYGKTETMIGTWFSKHKKRDKVILASKIAGPGFPYIRGGSDMTGETMREALDDSLKRLKTDYIDLYQLHWPNRGGYHFSQYWDYAPEFDKEKVVENFLDILKTSQDLINEGKIRHIGLSDETAWGMMKYLQLSEQYDLPRMQSIQNEYSLLCRLFEPDFQEISIAEKCGLLAWSPLATGMISGKYLDGKRPEGSRWALSNFNGSQRDKETAHNAVRAYMAVAEKHGLDVCQMALAFVNDRPFVTSNIIGATTMEQLKSNIASEQITLSDDVLDDIKDVYRQYTRPY